MSKGIGRFFILLAGFLLGPLFTPPGEANRLPWEASCRIHEIIEKKQDDELLESLENPSESDIRKEALKRGRRLELSLREAKLKQANLTIHLRELSDCIDDFVEQIPTSIELQVSNSMWKWVFPLYLVMFPLAISILGLVVSVTFGFGNLPGIFKRRKNSSG